MQTIERIVFNATVEDSIPDCRKYATGVGVNRVRAVLLYDGQRYVLRTVGIEVHRDEKFSWETAHAEFCCEYVLHRYNAPSSYNARTFRSFTKKAHEVALAHLEHFLIQRSITLISIDMDNKSEERRLRTELRKLLKN
jgi:hypothetical protein